MYDEKARELADLKAENIALRNLARDFAECAEVGKCSYCSHYHATEDEFEHCGLDLANRAHELGL